MEHWSEARLALWISCVDGGKRLQRFRGHGLAPVGSLLAHQSGRADRLQLLEESYAMD